MNNLDDDIISCLCVGYLIPYADVKCKRLIVNALDDDGNPIAKEIRRCANDCWGNEVKNDG